MPVLEIVSFPCSEGFINDRATVLGPGIEGSLQIPGYLRAYHALQIEKEDQEIGYIAAVWESYEDHKKIMELPNYEELVQIGLGPVLAGKHEVRHVENFRGNSEDILAAPVTEIVTIKLKEGISMDDLKDHLGKLSDVLRKSSGCHGVVWGECTEHRDTLINLLGWDDIEGHATVVKGEEVSSLISGILAKAHIQIRHASFVKYPAWVK